MSVLPILILFVIKLTAIHNLANKYRGDFNLPNLKLPFNSRHGFYFSIPQKDIQGKLPSQFIQVENKSFVVTWHYYLIHVFYYVPITNNAGNQAWEQYTLLKSGACFCKYYDHLSCGRSIYNVRVWCLRLWFVLVLYNHSCYFILF